MSGESPHWRVNMYVCLAGSFTTLTAMAMIIPFLPLYVEQLGVKDHAAIIQWTAMGYSAAFFGAGIMAPIWGRAADLYGRKIVLMRASLAMAITTTLLGLVQNVEQLVALRLIMGLLGGYSSGAVVLIATQTPKERTGWALGVLSTGSMAGMLIGPLIGGTLPGWIGVRATFLLLGALIFIAFIATSLLVKEDRSQYLKKNRASMRGAWSAIPDKRWVFALLGAAMLLLFANMSIEPIITLYVSGLVGTERAVFFAGLVMSVTAVGAIITASRLGKLTDRIGPPRVIVACLSITGLLLIPQAFVTQGWQLLVLRFLMGMTLAGLMPAISAGLRLAAPTQAIGLVLGYSISAQYAGQVLGPLAGGFVAGHFGMRAVFLATTAVLLVAAATTWIMERNRVASAG